MSHKNEDAPCELASLYCDLGNYDLAFSSHQKTIKNKFNFYGDK